MATIKKIRFPKRRMESVPQHKLDENHAQTLILGLFGAWLVLSRCVCQAARWRPGNYVVCSGDAQVPVARPLFTIIDSPENLT
jgi:hypothetical protein